MIYKFEGRQIRLTERDYNQWKKVYHAIPDFDAELQRIDDDDLPERWFPAVSAKLAAKHQKLVGQKQQPFTFKATPKHDDNVERVKKAYEQKKPWLAPKNLTDIRVLFGLGLISKEEAEFCGYRP